MKSAICRGLVILGVSQSTSGGQRKSKCVAKLEKTPLFGVKSHIKGKDQELILYQFLVLLWLRRQDSNLRPVAVPDKIFGLTLILDFIDRCHALSSLHPPPAALASLPNSTTSAYASIFTRGGARGGAFRLTHD